MLESGTAKPKGAAKILVVDDEAAVTDLLLEWLHPSGYTVVAAHDGQEGWQEFFYQRPDLAILDIKMPKMGGLDLTRRIREVSNIPILVLSAKGQEQDKVMALDLGADDYVVKPVGRRELLARVAAALRRASMEADANVESSYSDSVVAIDFSRYEVLVLGRLVSLTRLEYHLLTCLVRRARQVVTHDQLLDQVWGPEYESPDYVTWHIARLRQKVERDPTNPERIVTVRGVGYRYEPPHPSPS